MKTVRILCQTYLKLQDTRHDCGGRLACFDVHTQDIKGHAVASLRRSVPHSLAFQSIPEFAYTVLPEALESSPSLMMPLLATSSC